MLVVRPMTCTITLSLKPLDEKLTCESLYSELLTSEEKSGWRIASVNIKKMTLKRSGRKWFFKEPNTDELAKRLTLIFDHIHHPITLHLKTREISGQGEAVNGLGRRWYNNRNEHILSWNRIWLLCTRVLTAATSAMVLSKSRFEGLSVFNRCFGKVQSRDFVPLTKILTERGFATSVGASLKHLTLGFSTWIYLSEHYNPESVSGFQSNDKLRLDSYDSSNYEGVINFVRLFPNVESLDFVMYKTPRPPPKARTSYFRNLNPFEAVLKRQVSRPAVLFPRLKRLTVRGVELDHTDFMFFLHSHPTIEYLDMRNITARLELWSVVFHYIHNMQNLKEPVHLEGLDSYSGVVNLQPVDPAFQTPPSQVPEGTFFLDEWESEFSLDSAYVHTRDISLEEVRARLKFKPRPSITSSVRSRDKWFIKQRAEYGPPE